MNLRRIQIEATLETGFGGLSSLDRFHEKLGYMKIRYIQSKKYKKKHERIFLRECFTKTH